MKKNTLLILVCSGTILLCIFPVIINYFLMSWSLSSVYQGSSPWLGFISGYYGAIFGGIISGLFTFLGVWLTLKGQKRDNFIDSFPIKVKAIDDIIEGLKNIVERGENPNFIKGEAQYQNPNGFLYDISRDGRHFLEIASLSIDGTIYAEMKKFRDSIDELVDKYRINPDMKLQLGKDNVPVISPKSEQVRGNFMTELKREIEGCKKMLKAHRDNLEYKFNKYL